MLCVILSTGWLFSSFSAKAVKKRSWKLITITVIFLFSTCTPNGHFGLDQFLHKCIWMYQDRDKHFRRERKLHESWQEKKLSIYIPSPDRTERFFHRFFLFVLFFFVFAFSLFPSCLLWHKLVYHLITCQVGFKALLKARCPVKMVHYNSCDLWRLRMDTNKVVLPPPSLKRNIRIMGQNIFKESTSPASKTKSNIIRTHNFSSLLLCFVTKYSVLRPPIGCSGFPLFEGRDIRDCKAKSGRDSRL